MITTFKASGVLHGDADKRGWERNAIFCPTFKDHLRPRACASRYLAATKGRPHLCNKDCPVRKQFEFVDKAPLGLT